MFVSCSFPLLALGPQTVEAQRYAAGGVNDVRALWSLLGAMCCVLAAVCHHTKRKTSSQLCASSFLCVCECGALKLMSLCRGCLVFHFSVALHIKTHESPSRPPCQTTLYWGVCVCAFVFVYVCVHPFGYEAFASMFPFYNSDLLVVHTLDVLCLCCVGVCEVMLVVRNITKLQLLVF